MTLPTLTKLTAAIFPDSTTIVPSEVRQWGLEAETALNALFSRTPLINGAFVPSVAGNVLTVALKTLAGADPSSADPVYADFRHVTQTNGQGTVLAITAACNITVSGGAKVGFADAINGRLWVVLFNDGSTPRIGVFNAYGGNTAGAHGVIHPLYPSLVTSSTDEANDGSADSAGVIYTDTAVSAKAMIVLGHMTWETAMATAGLWSAAPDVVHQQRYGDKLPGDMVQRQANFDGAMTTGTTTTPFDNTIPTSSEGNQFQTQAITPKSKANILEIEHEANYAASAAGNIIAALFQDAGAAAIVAKAVRNTAAGDPSIVRLMLRMLAGTTSSTTFKIRTGNSAAATVTFNGSAGVVTFSAVNYARLEIVERMG